MIIDRIKVSNVVHTIAVPYITCSTAASTAAKTITLQGSDSTPVSGTQVVIKFTNGNTAPTPTLSVNGGTAKTIVGDGACKPAQYSAAGSIMHITYDGTNWIITG